MTALVGTAGWTIPRDVRDAFPDGGTSLQRYAGVLRCVEINSTFYRRHRPATFARWAAGVGEEFRFSLKFPKTITHVRRLLDCGEDVRAFLDDTDALGSKRGVLLAQFPPRFAFEPLLVERFFDGLRERYAGALACEPRHASWFSDAGERLLERYRIARVAADPALSEAAAAPGGWGGFAYYRMHGSPRTYYSCYEEERLRGLAAEVRGRPGSWCIFDNTALGAATGNALRFEVLLRSCA